MRRLPPVRNIATVQTECIGANVFLPSIQRGAAADIDGNFSILGVPPGTYEVRVSLVGYAAESRPVTVSASQGAILVASLEASDTDAVTVEYERPLIRNDAIGVPNVVSGADIPNLPVRGIVAPDAGPNPPPLDPGAGVRSSAEAGQLGAQFHPDLQ